MPGRKQLHEVYADEMAKHSLGRALYHPVWSSFIKPGSCGYFNDTGNWNPIADLSDAKKLEQDGYCPVSETLQKAPTGPPTEWGPRYSSSVKHAVIEMKAGVSTTLAGFPAEAKAFYEFSSTSDYGAILMTTPPIVFEAFLHEEPFRRWLNENARIILQKRPEVKKYEVFVVTSTYSAQRCALNASLNQQRSVKVGFATSAVSAGEVAPSGQWYQQSADSGWKYYGKDSKNPLPKQFKKNKRNQKKTEDNHQKSEIHSDEPGKPSPAKDQDKDRIVVFMNGLRFSYHMASNVSLGAFHEKKTNEFLETLSSCFRILVFILLSVVSLGLFPIFLCSRRQKSRGAPDPSHVALSPVIPHTALDLENAVGSPPPIEPLWVKTLDELRRNDSVSMIGGSTVAAYDNPMDVGQDYIHGIQDDSGTSFVVSVSPMNTPPPSVQNSVKYIPKR